MWLEYNFILLFSRIIPTSGKGGNKDLFSSPEKRQSWGLPMPAEVKTVNYKITLSK